MQRLVLFSVFIGLAVITAVSLVGLSLTYGLDAPPNRIAVPGLHASGTITLYDSDIPPALAVNDSSLYPALGALHGTRALWQAVLLRQVARGTMTEWLGESAEDVDRAMFSLDLEHRSVLAYNSLPQRDKDRLAAFARGFNAAMRETALSDRFMSLLSITPDPWEPWHALLVERLWLWLATEIDSSQIRALPSALEALHALENQRALVRQTLSLHGFQDQVQWTSTTGDTAIAHVRYVLGNSALPWLIEFQLPDQRYLLQLPGTPFTIASFSRDEARAYLPVSTARLDWVSTQARTSIRKKTFRLADGSEETIPLTFYDDALRLTRVVSTADSGLVERDLVLSWSGYSSQTDASVWLSLTPDFSSLRLFTPPVTVGQPPSTGHVALAHPTGWVQGAPRVAEALRSALVDVHSQGGDLRDAYTRTFSAYLYEKAKVYANVLSVAPRTLPAEQIAYTYLRGWDGQFEPSSIGATVFTYLESHLAQQWMAGDSLPEEAYRRAFSAAVEAITTDLGNLPLEWRWEKAYMPTLEFPVWGNGESIALPARIWRLYPPLSVLPMGSRYAFRYGPSPKQPTPAAASLEITWIREGSQTQMMVRRTSVDVYTFMARYLYELRERYPTPVWSANQGDVRIIHLVPTS